VERDPIEKMIGEAFREIGVLILVFAILDKLVSGSITWAWSLTALLSGTVVFGAGVYLERRRRDG
jgi:hypothetical protein